MESLLGSCSQENLSKPPDDDEDALVLVSTLQSDHLLAPALESDLPVPNAFAAL
jgi:hypothetical protein